MLKIRLPQMIKEGEGFMGLSQEDSQPDFLIPQVGKILLIYNAMYMYTLVDRKSCPREKLHVKTLSLRGPYIWSVNDLPGQRPPGETHQKL